MQNNYKERYNYHKQKQNDYKETQKDHKKTQSDYKETQNDYNETKNYFKWHGHVSYRLGFLFLCSGVGRLSVPRGPFSHNVSMPTYPSTRSSGGEEKMSQYALGRWKRGTLVRRTVHKRTNIPNYIHTFIFFNFKFTWLTLSISKSHPKSHILFCSILFW